MLGVGRSPLIVIAGQSWVKEHTIIASSVAIGSVSSDLDTSKAEREDLFPWHSPRRSHTHASLLTGEFRSVRGQHNSRICTTTGHSTDEVRALTAVRGDTYYQATARTGPARMVPARYKR